MKRLLFIIIALQFPIVLIAQVISGRVRDAEGEPISYANVALCQKSDSTLLFGVVTNHDGCFEIKVEDAENSFLRVSCVGFQVQNVEIKKFP